MKEISVKTSDDVRLSGRLFSSQDNPDVVLHVPGMVGNAYSINYYNVLKEKLPENGIDFLTTETRTGTRIDQIMKENPGLTGQVFDERFEDSIYDIDAWVAKLLELGYEKIWLFGSSLGPAKVVNWFHHRRPDNVSGLIFLSPSDMIGLVHDPLGIKDHKIMLPKAKELISEGRGDEFLDHLLWGVKRMTARSYVDLFGENSEAEVFNFHDPSKGWRKVNCVDVPVLAFSGTEDDGISVIMDVYEAMDMLSKELKNCPRKKFVVYEGCNHNFEGFEDQFVEEMVRFIKG